MSPKKKKTTKEKKGVSFLLDDDIRERVDEFCEKQSISISNFLRDATIKHLENPIPQTTKEIVTISAIDKKSFDLMFQKLSDLELKFEKSMDYLIERQQTQIAVAGDIVEAAKEILLEKKPKNYDDAFLYIEDVDTLTEAINQLHLEKKVKYQRSKLKWQ